MITYRHHLLTTNVSPARQLILPGDSTRVVVVICQPNAYSSNLFVSEDSGFNGLIYFQQNTFNDALLFRDYGTLIQGQLFMYFGGGGDPYTVTEILDNIFRNY